MLILLPIAFLVGSRLMYDIARWIRLRRREKSQLWRDRLNGSERACWRLTTADFIVSLVFLLLLVWPIARAFLCVFGQEAKSATQLPDAYRDGTLLKWQLGVSAAYLLWAVIQSVVRPFARRCTLLIDCARRRVKAKEQTFTQ